ncbi:endolysin [Salmonella enterica subsp. diarizonae]|nr:endolysin [Salmonella enterica subsp. diarizonae]
MKDLKKRLPGIIRMVALVALAACGGWQLSDYSGPSPDSIQYFPYPGQNGELTVCLNHQGTDVQPRPYSWAECIAFLKTDLTPVYNALNTQLNKPLTEEQKNALAVFMFSAGNGAVPDTQSGQAADDETLLLSGFQPVP